MCHYTMRLNMVIWTQLNSYLNWRLRLLRAPNTAEFQPKLPKKMIIKLWPIFLVGFFCRVFCCCCSTSFIFTPNCASAESYIPPEPKTSQSQWYHGTLDRKEAQNILNQHAQIMMDKRKSDQTIQTDNNYSFDENDDVRLIFYIFLTIYG